MQVRHKVALSVISILLILVVAMNMAFGVFFQRYVRQQEDRQIEVMLQSLSAHFTEKEDKFLGTVNDWSHWDDTYFFLNGTFDEYVALNLTASTFDNLDLNFFVLTDNSGTIAYQQYYDHDGAFMDFPEDFSEAFPQVIGDIWESDDAYAIIQIGSDFYYTAASDVTDSILEKPAKGKLIIGKMLDNDDVKTMEDISGCDIGTMRIISGEELTRTGSGSDGAALVNTVVSEEKATAELNVLIGDYMDTHSGLIMELRMPRTIFITAMKDVRYFSVVNTLGFILLSLLVLWHIRLFITKPFRVLVNEIKKVDIKKQQIEKLRQYGKDEFSFIRSSVNSLLTEIEINQAQLVESREALRATLISVGDGVIAVDNDGFVTFLNPVAERMTGWRQDEALGRPIEEIFDIINEYDRKPVRSPVYTVFERDEIIELSNHTLLLSKNGDEIPIEDTAAPIKNASGKTVGCVLVFRDFSERREKQRRIEYLSFHDQLTGLYNRRYFEEELARLDQEKTYPVSLIYADVNGLKIINDAFGHENGDRVIRWVAEVFTAVCANDTVARIGGDEFIILLLNTGREAVKKIVERLRFQTADMAYNNVDLSISYGWDTKENAVQSTFGIFKNAEDQMYRIKLLSNSSNRHDVIKSILNTLHVKCPREGAHSRRVRDICKDIGTACGLASDELRELVAAGELHDIGKIAIDEVVLEKTGTLSPREWEQIKRHPETGYRLLSATNEFVGLAETVLSHHERWDGKGYPRGLAGEAISRHARVIAIADSYDAMTSDRPYRKALSLETAAEEIRRGAGTQFDPELARIFIEKVLGLAWE